jgi:long-chain acyl-CoA synthetase
VVFSLNRASDDDPIAGRAKIVSKRMKPGTGTFDLARRAIFDQNGVGTSMQVTHPEMVAQCAPERTALLLADTGETLTYGALAADANRIAHYFAKLGLQHGDVVACLLHNGPDLWRMAWAAKNAGLRYVLIGTRLNAKDIAYIIRDSGARVLVTEHGFVERLEGEGLANDGLAMLLTTGAQAPFSNLHDLIVSEPETALPGRKRGASMLYSSGTTGRPKGVKAVLADVPPEEPPARHALLMRNYGLGPQTVFITAAPFYHAGPLRIAMAVQRAGGTVVAFRKFDAEALLAAIEKHRATHGFFVPTMFQRMLDLPQAVRDRFDLRSMQHAIHGAAPCAAQVKRAMINWWGPVIDELYGGTESIGQTFISSKEWLSHPGSVGRPSGQVEVRIVDAAGHPVAAGVAGRVMLRNPQRFAYHGEAAATAGEAYDADGFASLGDIGYLDEDGYLYLTDRESNMIISGGVNIYPQEAESVLLEHPAVADSAVIGIPDRDMGEVAKALVVVRPGIVADAELAGSILTFCNAQLSRFKCPRSLDFVNELPRNELAKLVKRDIHPGLREQPGRFIAD